MTPEQIAAGAACYQCLNEDQKRAAILYLLDQFASGGSGGSGLFVLKAGDTMTGRLVSPNINYTAQGSTPAAPASGFVEFADSSGRKSWIRGSDGFVRTWDSTLTGNRVFSLPDATTTIAGLAVAQTFTLANTFSANGALSAPAVSFTGTPITGGTATTTKPLVLVETAGATSTTWSTSGTMLGVNAPSGFIGRLFSLQNNAVERVYSTYDGEIGCTNLLVTATSGLIRITSDTILSRKAAANLQLGTADAAAPVAQTLSVQSVVAGTTDTAGANWTINASRGTGTGAGGAFIWQVAPAGSTGSSQNSLVEALRLTSTGLLRFGAAGSSASPVIFPFAGSTYTVEAPSTGRGLTLWNYSNTAGDIGTAFGGGTMTQTSGTQRHLYVARPFAPTSGTGVYNHFELAPTINQTGGANGITRGLYINPTLTAAADFRALEIAAGKTIFAANGALSEPAVSFTGTPITGGTATTTKPMVLIETSGATSTAWAITGTMFGVNAPSGFGGNIADFQVNGASRFSINSGGSITIGNNVQINSASSLSWSGSRGILTSPAAGQIQLGAADAASAVAQTLSVQSVVAGTSNTAGADWTQRGSLGTGTGASGNIVFQLGTPAASGTTQHTASTGLTLSNVGTSGTAAHRATFAGTVATAGYTVATLPAAGTAGRRAYVTDATAPTYLGALVGGGAVVCPVFDNGSAWVSA